MRRSCSSRHFPMALITPARTSSSSPRRSSTPIRGKSASFPGLGHTLHRPVDPGVLRLFAIAAETGFNGRYVDLMKCIHARAEAASGRMMPINATGAIGALACELGFPPRSMRGLGVLGRAIGLVGHIMEEWEQPMAVEIWRRVDEEVSEAARKKRSV